MDDIKDWTGLSAAECVKRAEQVKDSSGVNWCGRRPSAIKLV